ncbi:MAG: hypothetical protein WCD52_05725 [Xanthobacteraceae bacterium]
MTNSHQAAISGAIVALQAKAGIRRKHRGREFAAEVEHLAEIARQIEQAQNADEAMTLKVTAGKILIALSGRASLPPAITKVQSRDWRRLAHNAASTVATTTKAASPVPSTKAKCPPDRKRKPKPIRSNSTRQRIGAWRQEPDGSGRVWRSRLQKIAMPHRPFEFSKSKIRNSNVAAPPDNGHLLDTDRGGGAKPLI